MSTFDKSSATKNDLSPIQFWIVATTIMALALGGATELGAQSVIAAVTALILLLAPPRKSLGILPDIVFISLFLLALAAFLPAGWFAQPPWRQHLTTDLNLHLSSTRTPQPWLTAQACSLFFIGLAWAYFLLGRRWSRVDRLQVVSLLVLGVAVLASIAILAFVSGFHVSGWKQEENRGWFPNRNQTADVLALAGILNYALIVDRLRKRDASGLFWLATLLPIGAGLVVSFSRSGIILFLMGIALWHAWPGSARHHAKWTVTGLSVIFSLLALFFLFGGDTLARFQGHAATSLFHTTDSDAGFRLTLQHDALRFSRQDPWLGVGLGNFDALFATARADSINQSRALHPESDWLWTACEMGWPAVFLLLAGIAWWLRQCLPFDPDKRGESLRRAPFIAVLVFLLHGLIDVSGHRVGSLWVALLLASLALPSGESFDPADFLRVAALRPVALLFRGIALLLLVVAFWWFSSLNDTPREADRPDHWLPPTTAQLDRLKTRIISMGADKRPDVVEDLANAGLKIAPLDWRLYFQRAWAEVYHKGELAQAAADFSTARALEPDWAQLCLDEGVIWLAVDEPDLCMDAWQEALRRDPASDHGHFAEMVRRAAVNDLVTGDLAELALSNNAHLLIFLENSSPKAAQDVLNLLMAADPELKSFDPDQRTTLFTDWWAKGDQAALAALLLSHPDWQNQGWPWLAQYYAQQKNYQQAWQTVAAHAVAPPLPAEDRSVALADLEHSFYANPGNTAAGLVLLQAELKAGNIDDALAAVRALEKNPDHPPHISYYEALLWADKQQWDLAWTAWNTNP